MHAEISTLHSSCMNAMRLESALLLVLSESEQDVLAQHERHKSFPAFPGCAKQYRTSDAVSDVGLSKEPCAMPEAYLSEALQLLRSLFGIAVL